MATMVGFSTETEQDEKQTQREVRINSTTIVIVTILGFIVSIGLYIFFVIIPLRRTEAKADAVLQSVQDTSNSVSKVVTDIENILHDVKKLEKAIEERVQAERTLLCNDGAAAICSALGPLAPDGCVDEVNTILYPICKAPTQPAALTPSFVTTEAFFTSNPGSHQTTTHSRNHSTTTMGKDVSADTVFDSTTYTSSSGPRYQSHKYRSAQTSHTLASHQAPSTGSGQPKYRR